MIDHRYRLFLVAGALLASLSSGCFPPPSITGTISGPRVTVATPRVTVAAPAPSVLGSGVINYPGEVVRFTLPITFPRTVTIYVQGHGVDPTVTLFDAYGGQLGFNDDGGSGLDAQLVSTVQPGNYVVQVAGFGGTTGAFTVSVQ